MQFRATWTNVNKYRYTFLRQIRMLYTLFEQNCIICLCHLGRLRITAFGMCVFFWLRNGGDLGSSERPVGPQCLRPQLILHERKNTRNLALLRVIIMFQWVIWGFFLCCVPSSLSESKDNRTVYQSGDPDFIEGDHHGVQFGCFCIEHMLQP